MARANLELVEKNSRHLLFSAIGSFLSSRRIALNLRQSDVAEISGYSSQFISNIECGAAFPPVNLLAKMIEAYRLTENEFIEKIMELQLAYYREVYFGKKNSTSNSSQR